MVAVLKTAVSIFGTVGSNPTPSVFSNVRLQQLQPVAMIYKASF